jgi:hypothetical protein
MVKRLIPFTEKEEWLKLEGVTVVVEEYGLS